MKIKKTILKKFIKEVIASVNEISTDESSFVVDMTSPNYGTVTIENLSLPDGRTLDFAEVEIEGVWDDGAFDYEYGSIKGTHRYTPVFQIEKQIIKTPLDGVAKEEVERYMENHEKEIVEYIEQNPVEPYEPEDDERRPFNIN